MPNKLPEIDSFRAEQVARIATAIAKKEYRDHDVFSSYDVICVLQAAILLIEEIEVVKSQET